jgi:hypothetical protein
MVRGSADLVLAMEKYHIDKINDLLFFRCKYALLLGSFAADRENPEIEDPYGLALDAYETCAARSSPVMPALIDHLHRQVERECVLSSGRMGTLRQQIIDLLSAGHDRAGDLPGGSNLRKRMSTGT